MTFSEALELLKQGKKIKREAWGGYWEIQLVMLPFAEEARIIEGQGVYVKNMIIAKLATGGYAPAQPYQADLLADDWEVVK